MSCTEHTALAFRKGHAMTSSKLTSSRLHRLCPYITVYCLSGVFMRCSIRCDRIFLSSTVDTTWSILMCFAPYHVRLPKICFTCLTWWTLAFQHLKELNLRRVGHLHQHSLTTTTEPRLFSAGTSWASWNDKHVDARWKKLMQIICKCTVTCSKNFIKRDSYGGGSFGAFHSMGSE